MFINDLLYGRISLKLDDAPAEALAIILLSFSLTVRTVDSFLLNLSQRDVNLSPDFNRSRISNDVALSLSLSFLEIFGATAGKYYFLFLTLNTVKKDCLTLQSINIHFAIGMNPFLK